jgi:hypothetical protein
MAKPIVLATFGRYADPESDRANARGQVYGAYVRSDDPEALVGRTARIYHKSAYVRWQGSDLVVHKAPKGETAPTSIERELVAVRSVGTGSRGAYAILEFKETAEDKAYRSERRKASKGSKKGSNARKGSKGSTGSKASDERLERLEAGLELLLERLGTTQKATGSRKATARKKADK